MNKLIVILGPTATGKTSLGTKLSYRYDGEIISADSRQIYKGMDIGTGKDLIDYAINNITIPYHLIDITSPKEEFNVFMFKRKFLNIYNEIIERGKTPFLVGGTGLYLSSIVQNYNMFEVDVHTEEADELRNLDLDELKNILLELNPEHHNKKDFEEKERMVKAILIDRHKKDEKDFNFVANTLVLGVNPGRDIVKQRITRRLKERLETGMISEVENLLNSGVPSEKLLKFGLEYKYVTLYVLKQLNYNDMFQKLNSAIHAFAKRQMTWFRKMEREGVQIHWLNSPYETKAVEIIEKFIKN